jgi:hypothetical protein
MNPKNKAALSAQHAQPKPAQKQVSHTLQPKVSVQSPTAPPIYRPQRSSKSVQLQTQQTRRQPVAPPVFRPQPVPKCLQMKKHAGGGQQPNQVKEKTAPSIPRPNASPNVKQAITSQAAMNRPPTVLQRMKTVKGGGGIDMMKLFQEERAKRLAQKQGGVQEGVKLGEIKEQEKPPQKTLIGLWLRQGNHRGDINGAGYYLGDVGGIDVNDNGWLGRLRYSLQITRGQLNYVGQWLHIIEIHGHLADYESYVGALNKGYVGGVDLNHVAIRATRQNQANDTVNILEQWVVQQVN